MKMRFTDFITVVFISAVFSFCGRDRKHSIRRNKWRRRSESNRWIKVLQTSALPLGYAALIVKRKAKATLAGCSSLAFAWNLGAGDGI